MNVYSAEGPRVYLTFQAPFGTDKFDTRKVTVLYATVEVESNAAWLANRLNIAEEISQDQNNAHFSNSRGQWDVPGGGR